jgi:N-methylhydantoinase B
MGRAMTPIDLAILISRVESVCQEMGVVLRRAAFSPNIKDRLDFSCALFNGQGELFAQAAHIPVHLGSMAYAMADIVDRPDWEPGDMLVVNDPYLGGTHLPDVTLISPLFVAGTLLAFVCNRAHHANIGASTPGSMPVSKTLEEEGLIIPPTFLVKKGEPVQQVMAQLDQLDGGSGQVFGDFSAQMSANRIGLQRLTHLIESGGVESFLLGVDEINAYGDRLSRNTLAKLPLGSYQFIDLMDDDGCGTKDIPIAVKVTVTDECIDVDFTGTADQVEGNINCPISVAAAAVFYVFRCLLPPQTPACAGTFRSIRLSAPDGCLVNAQRPAAVAAGNVETSMRIVDVVLGALAGVLPDLIPAAAQGTMNNVAMGSRSVAHGWDYYETIAGGMGGSASNSGLTGVQSHMTNTLNTPIESLEMHYPVRVNRYLINRDSGGAGLNPGGDGLIREFEFLEPTEVTLLSERRRHPPWGLKGGQDGTPGENRLNDVVIAGKCHFEAKAGDTLVISTPGGGGWGEYSGESRVTSCEEKKKPGTCRSD